MNRKQMLMIIAMEECDEVSQRISKALRFTLDEVQPGQLLSNAERILEEFNDLYAVIEMLQDEEPQLRQSIETMRFQIEAKKVKVDKFLSYSKEVGTLHE